ncbi:hypothetical protein [Nocardia sp. NPDC049149]|uniref:hypothetical protein n=1 Tax=Nocardia sp. NPDC049149 TaxID=3364315 RepID=UPI0037229195
MRKAILASVAFATMIGGYPLVIAAPANAVSDADSCVEVGKISNKFNDDIDALNGEDPEYRAKLKGVYKGTSASFAAVASKADDGELKGTIGNAADQMDRVSSEPDDVFIKTPQDKNSDLMKALTKLDNACPAR